MQAIDLSTWNRREHFEFFCQFDEPYFGVTVNLDLTKAYATCKANGWSVFLYYLYQSAHAANSVEALRYRIRSKDEVVIFDHVHPHTAVMRTDQTFVFAPLMLMNRFSTFALTAQETMAEVRATEGIGLKPDPPLDVIHYSTLPWLPFSSLSHARNYRDGDSVPKISFGKFVKEGDRILLPMSVHTHHGLADGYHVGMYYEALQARLDEGAE